MTSLVSFCRVHRTLQQKITSCRLLSQISGRNDVVIVSAMRTPFGSFQGDLASLSAMQLGGHAIKAAVEKAGIPKDEVKDVCAGMVFQTGVRHAPAKQAALLGGLSHYTEASTINKACASGMKALMFSVQSLMLGQQDVMVACGMESMSNVPYFIRRNTLKMGDAKVQDCMLYDGLLCAFDPKYLMGHYADYINKKFGITREDQDNYCLESYRRAKAAWESGILSEEVIPVEVSTRSGKIKITEDEEYKKVKPEKISQLKPVFEKEGSVTAANASKNADGGSAVVLMTAEAAERLRVKPMARVIAMADDAQEPRDFTVAAGNVCNKLLDKTGVRKEDIALWELNEAFSNVPIANMKVLDIDHSRVNIHGGAVSLGHPVSASGTRIVGRLAYALQPGQLGVASICNGGGAASAVMLEKLNK